MAKASFFVFVFSLVFPSLGHTQELTAERVRRSIDRAAEYLFRQQNANGSWAGSDRDKEGVTALATLALINSGVSADDPRIIRAIQRMNAVPLTPKFSTYVVSLRLMVLAAADPKGQLYRPQMRKDVQHLVDIQVKTGANKGAWNYAFAGPGDSSNTQYALLGLHAAAGVGMQVDSEVWSRALTYWQNCFVSKTGGFGYGVTKQRVNGSMVCAGVCSTIICEENLANVDQFVSAGEVVCCQPNANSEMIEKGLQWLAKRFSVTGNPQPRGFARLTAKFYYMYGMERLGRLSGRRFIGDHDWYREGATELLRTQKTDGFWKGTASHLESEPVISTSFALLFLSKGKRPIVVGKYKIGVGNDWNRHPTGVHYLSRELEEQWAAKLNWQTIDGEKATVQDLSATPVLFISGRDQLDLTQAQKDALKAYVENGNFIFAEASQGNGCGENADFDQKFRALMAELFPETQLEALSASHPIWNSYFPLQATPDWPVLGLQACCRTSVVYCPRSLTGHWQLNREAMLKKLPRKAKAEVDYATQFGVNVVSYATGRQLRDKLDAPQIANATVSVLENRSLVLPKLDHRGGSDDAPNAWRNILRHANEFGLTIDLGKKIVDVNSEELYDHPFVFMHGRNDFFYKNAEIELLQRYLKGGNRGFIFADAICSNRIFQEAFEKQANRIFPDQKLEGIPADHPMWTDQYGGFDLRTVTITKPDRRKQDGFAKRTVAPQFKGIKIKGRYVVVYSPFDLSCALENTTYSNCEGYTRDDAIKLGINVILYRLLVD